MLPVVVVVLDLQKSCRLGETQQILITKIIFFLIHYKYFIIKIHNQICWVSPNLLFLKLVQHDSKAIYKLQISLF